MSNSRPDKDTVVLGQLGRVHGIKGWLKLISFTTPIENILDYSRFWVNIEGRKQQLEIDDFRRQSRALLVHIKGYDGPEAATQLTGIKLSVASEKLPKLENGEFYWHQLEGLTVVNQHKQLFGRVSNLLETGANDVLVVAATNASIDDRERLIPYLVGSVVSKIDLNSETIVVNWEADYLD